MPRMPVEYKNYLSTVGKNQIRLWELSAVKYIAAPASMFQQLQQNPQLAKQFESVLSYQVPTAQGMRKDVLLKFKNTIPRFSLFQGWDVLPLDQHCTILASPQHAAASTLLLASDCGFEPQADSGAFQALEGRITKKTASVNVRAQRPSIVRFAQHYQHDWRVYVDGEKRPLLQVDYLCMGVHVPAGEHAVEFKCISGMPQALFALGVLVLSVALAVLLIWQGGKTKE
jgi:hypothetical protein